MKYLLDTNTCIRYINGRAPQPLLTISLQLFSPRYEVERGRG